MTVTVSGMPDADTLDERTTVSLAVSASGEDYAGQTDEVAVRVSDDDPAMKLSFSSSNYEAPEGGTPATVVVLAVARQRRGRHLPAAPVRAGPCHKGLRLLRFARERHGKRGQTGASFTITATDDVTADEDNNMLKLGMREMPLGFAAGNPTNTTVKLLDNDVSQGLPLISIASASAEEGDDLVFRIGIERPTDKNVKLFGWTKDITAVYNRDYKAPHPVEGLDIQVGLGLTSAEIRLATIEDSIVETDETFELGLSRTAYCSLKKPSTVIATIRDDDNSGQPYVGHERRSQGSAGAGQPESRRKRDVLCVGRAVVPRPPPHRWRELQAVAYGPVHGEHRLRKGESRCQVTSASCHRVDRGLDPVGILL